LSAGLSLESRGSSGEGKLSTKATSWVCFAFNSMRRSEVRRLTLTALMIWALCFVGADCGSAKIQGPRSSNQKIEELPAAPVLTLTNDQPKKSLPIKAGEFASDAEVLEVSITKVKNPGMTPLSIFVYLSDSAKGKSESELHLVGNFSLYPPDQPGKFLLSAAPELRN